MKANITVSIDTNVAKQFKARYDKVSPRIEQLMKADIDFEEPQEDDIDQQITMLKTHLADKIEEKSKMEEEKEKDKLRDEF